MKKGQAYSFPYIVIFITADINMMQIMLDMFCEHKIQTRTWSLFFITKIVDNIDNLKSHKEQMQTYS